jgi:hypothetical protein
VLRHVQVQANIDAIRKLAAAPVDLYEGAVIQEMSLDVLNRWHMPNSGLRHDRGLTLFSARMFLSGLAVLTPSLLYIWRVRKANKSAGVQASVRWPRIALLMLYGLLGVLWLRSYVERDALAGGHWDIGCWDGDVCVVYRVRSDVAYERPWRFRTSVDLWPIRTRYEQPYSYHSMMLGGRWAFGGGQEKALEDVFPMWTMLMGFSIPFWAIVAGVSVPPTGMFLYSIWKNWDV